jgi:hypothetical protein
MPQAVQEHFRSIKLRPEDAEALLRRTGFCSVEELREGGHRGFDRPLLLCRKAASAAGDLQGGGGDVAAATGAAAPATVADTAAPETDD